MLKATLKRILLPRYYAMPMRQKLLVTVLATSLASVLFAGLALFLIQLRNLRSEFREHFLALTRVVADQAIAPLSFEDHEALRQVLQSFQAKAEVTAAWIVLPNGTVIARFGADEKPARSGPLTSGINVKGWEVRIVQPLELQGRSLAHMAVTASFQPVFTNALTSFLPSLLVVLVIALAIATTITLAISRLFIRDLERLTRTASKIAETNDFTVRATANGTDEIGTLTGSFNRMLDRLQAGDLKLRSVNQSLNHEITERARVEAQLLEASRLAGMAQVATGVLHNVGNVLNSVNISAQILRTTLSDHPHLGLLDQTTALLKSQGDQLTQFLTEDPRGRLVPRLLIELGTHLAMMRRELLKEADHLTQNVEHIKQIISMQQNYAKAGGVIQRLNPVELIGESLRIAQASVNRHGVTILREDSCPGEMTTDRHQALQILVNFITNAVQAVKVRPAGERIVRLKVKQGGDRVIFSVEDNGVGIPRENLQKLFQHGFTTRKDGHGFGLHSGALAARNLGGQVNVFSSGPGQGSCFTLELPLNCQTETASSHSSLEPSHELV